MKKLSCALLLCTFLCALCVSFSANVSSPDKTVTIADGTEISAATTETLSSKTSHEGDLLTFKVNEDVIIDGSVVIAKGAILKGVVTDSKRSGAFGKSGKLNIRIDTTTTVDGQTLKVRASKGKSGDSKTGATVALVVLFGPVGFLKHGKQAEIKEGTLIKVFTDEAKTVTIKDVVAAPVPTP